jgi:hypothetical protein
MDADEFIIRPEITLYAFGKAGKSAGTNAMLLAYVSLESTC